MEIKRTDEADNHWTRLDWQVDRVVERLNPEKAYPLGDLDESAMVVLIILVRIQMQMVWRKRCAGMR